MSCSARSRLVLRHLRDASCHLALAWEEACREGEDARSLLERLDRVAQDVAALADLLADLERQRAAC